MITATTIPPNKTKSLERIVAIVGAITGWTAWGVVHGIQKFPLSIEDPIFIGLYILAAEALAFSIWFWLEEQLGMNPPRRINIFCNGLIAAYGALSLILALATHSSPI